MNQRPSRNLIGELARREKELAEKNVAVLLVHTSSIDPAKLKEWLDNQNIPFTCGSIEIDAEKVLFRWGVRAQPWLILTDEEGVVRAEGFGFEQLDEKLKVEESAANNSRVPVLAKSAEPSGVDKSVVKVDLSVIEVPPDSKMDTETIITIRNLLAGKITVPDSPAVADLLRKAAGATAAVKDKSAGNKRVTQQQFNKLFDMLVSLGFVKILMNPTLEVVDGQTAKITSTNDSIEITPSILKDGNIILQANLALSQKSTVEQSQQTPIVSKHEISTRICLNPGQSGIIGGTKQAGLLTEPGNAVKDLEVPATELLIILTPTIVGSVESKEPMEKVNFKDAEVRTVIEQLAAWTGKTIIPPADLLKQKITIYSPEQMPRSEAAAMILNSLRSKGYTAEQSDDTILLKTTPEEQPGTDKSQIMIDTKILTVSDEFLKDIGFDANSISDANTRPEHAPVVLAPPDNLGTYQLILNDLQVAFLLKAAQAQKDAKILSSPRVTVQDGEKAEMFIGQEIPFVSDYNEPNSTSDKPTPKIEKLKSGTSIWLRPRLTPDKENVYLDFELELRRLLGFNEHTGTDKQTQKTPIVDVDRIKTPCTVPDGKTLLITGKKIFEQKTETKKSLLSDLPLIGGLFSSTTKTEETRYLLILIKPAINPPIKAPPKPQPIDPNDPLIIKLEEKFNRSDEQK